MKINYATNIGEIEERLRQYYGYPETARAVSTKEREQLADKGKALPDGSFPIANASDLRNAIKAYGRAKDKAAAKRHIIKRARALKLTALLPEDWKAEKAELEISDEDITRAFLVEADGRTILTAPAALGGLSPEFAASPNRLMLWLQGAFVGGEKANRNGALWSTADLEMGEPTVRHGPLNWLHQARHVVGAIADSRMVAMDESRLGQPYIAASAAVWRWLWPEEARVIEAASEARQLWYSMECVSREVSCIDHSCGSWSYLDAVVQKAAHVCEHVREKSGTRRFIDPVFLGGAVIVPPVRPGWGEANAELMREAAAFSERTFEQAGQPQYSASDWEALVAGVLEYAHAA